MAKSCSMTGAEIARYLEVNGALISVRDDGTRWGKSLSWKGWKRLSSKKPEIPMETWKANKLAYVAALPWWASKVTSLPSLKTVEAWSMDCVCETVTGYEPVEPDGVGPDGAPSWLRALCLI